MSTRVTAIPHGSALGFERGCRSRGGCANHGSPFLLTCAEAHIARHRDHGVARLSKAAAIPRSPRDLERMLRDVGRIHGTNYGYRRGCHDPLACPNYDTPRPTCAHARASYVLRWSTARRDGAGSPISHGTVAGYFAGCRDAEECPTSEGVSCAAARRAHRRERARAAGAEAMLDVDAIALAARLSALKAPAMSTRGFARDLGIGRTTLTRLLAPHTPVVRLSAHVLAIVEERAGLAVTGGVA